MRYKYLRDEKLKNILLWISFEKENKVEKFSGFKFAKFLTCCQKYEWYWTEKKKFTSKNVYKMSGWWDREKKRVIMFSVFLEKLDMLDIWIWYVKC